MKKRISLLVLVMFATMLFSNIAIASTEVIDESNLNSIAASEEENAKMAKRAKQKEKDLQIWLTKYYEETKKNNLKNGEVNALAINTTYHNAGTPVCKQETTYWCGPASGQAALKVRSKTATQTQIATESGTTTSGTVSVKLADAINYFLGTTYYVAIDETTQIGIYQKLTALSYPKYAQIPLLKTKYLVYYNNKDLRHYSPTKDFTAAYNGTDPSSYNYDYSKATLADVNYNSTYGGYHTVAFNELYQAVKNSYIAGGNKNFIY